MSENLKTGGPKHFRRLKWNELVGRGDFVTNGRQGFQPWEGPSGFQAGTFVKPIYRQDKKVIQPQLKNEMVR